jgi:hypothetical protein
VLADDETIRRNEATLKAALPIVANALEEVQRAIERRGRATDTLEQLEVKPPEWPDSPYDRVLGKRGIELDIARREIAKGVLERIRFLGLLAYPSRLGVKLKGWMVIADKLADETLQIMQALARRTGRRQPRGYGSATRGSIIPFVGERLRHALPDSRLPGDERLRQILELIRADRVRRNEQFEREYRSK